MFFTNHRYVETFLCVQVWTVKLSVSVRKSSCLGLNPLKSASVSTVSLLQMLKQRRPSAEISGAASAHKHVRWRSDDRNTVNISGLQSFMVVSSSCCRSDCVQSQWSQSDSWRLLIWRAQSEASVWTHGGDGGCFNVSQLKCRQKQSCFTLNIQEGRTVTAWMFITAAECGQVTCFCPLSETQQLSWSTLNTDVTSSSHCSWARDSKDGGCCSAAPTKHFLLLQLETEFFKIYLKTQRDFEGKTRIPQTSSVFQFGLCESFQRD